MPHNLKSLSSHIQRAAMQIPRHQRLQQVFIRDVTRLFAFELRAFVPLPCLSISPPLPLPPSHEPGPPQSLFLLKGSFSSHFWLFWGRALGFCTGPAAELNRPVELKYRSKNNSIVF